MKYYYAQREGRFFDALKNWIANGYSGWGAGLNNPMLEHVQDLGPIPIGLWTMGTAVDDAKTGPLSIPLNPAAQTGTYGRSGFMIHGDSIRNPGQASRGCIVMPLWVRRQMLPGDMLHVVPDITWVRPDYVGPDESIFSLLARCARLQAERDVLASKGNGPEATPELDRISSMTDLQILAMERTA